MNSPSVATADFPSPIRVYIVEDEALIGMEIADRLSSLGYIVCGSASRGEQALLEIETVAPHVVLMDVRLAGALTGIETAARLRETGDLPVIFLSAYSDAQLLRQAGEVQPFGYLVKPFEERELHATIQMAIYKHRMERALREANTRLDEKVRERTAELARSRADLAITLDSIGDAVLATDVTGRITRMNPVAESLTGWSRTEAVGRPIEEVFRIIHEQTREPAVIPIAAVLASGERHSLANHTALITRTGIEISIADSAAPIRDAAGQIVGAVLVFRDETEARERRKLVARQRAIAEALRRTQQQFIDSGQSHAPFEDILTVLLEATQSAAGFIGEVSWSPQGVPALESHAASPGLWNDPPASPLKELIDQSIRSGKVVKAHEPPLPACLIAPLLASDQVVGVVGIANRTGGYDGVVLAEIQPLLATCASLIEARRNAVRRRAAEYALQQLNAHLESEVTRRTDQLSASLAELKQMEQALRVLSTELVALEGPAFYQALTRHLASLLDCEIALVARLKINRETRLETLAVFEDGHSAAELSWNLPMSPWTVVTLGQTVVIPSCRQDASAPVAFLLDKDIIGFAAVPLLDHGGVCLGQIAVMSRRALTDPDRIEAILKLFAISAGAEMERQRSSRRFHDLFEFSPDAIVITDRDGTVRLANCKAEAMFGWSRTDLAGQDIELLIPAEGRARHRLLREHFLASDPTPALPPDRSDLRAKRKDGTVFPVEIALGTIETGDGLMIAAAIRDVTERRNSERRASRARRLESIGTLAGGIAHDLNNALAPVLLALDILKQRYPQEHDTLDNVERSASHAVEMVRHLLTYARGSEGIRVSVELRGLLEEMEKIAKGTFPKNIEVRLHIPQKLPAVLGDATQLHQVLLNLCVNARDAMPRGGILTLSAEPTDNPQSLGELPGSKAGKRISQGVILRVSDTGEGIAADVLDKIFDPFFSTKGHDTGTGLGLFTVAGIIKGHEGVIRASSKPGQGATFEILLPALESAPEPATHPIRTENLSGHGELILYVDDEPAVREAVRTVLQILGFSPLTAPDGATGLKQAIKSRRKLSAVITDLHMPVMDGVAFVRALRQEMPEVPVIVASGRLEPSMSNELRLLGVDVFLEKPFTREKLGRALREVLADRLPT